MKFQILPTTSVLLVLLSRCSAFVTPNKKSASNRASVETSTQCQAFPGRLLWGLTVAGVASSAKVVRQGDVAIVERLGKFHQCLEPGFHWIIPVVDHFRATLTRREQVFDIPPQQCITLDNAPLAADAVVYWKVMNPENAVYSVVDLELAIQNLVLTQLRSEVGKLTLDDTFSAREQINSVLLKDLDVATEPWGVKISRVEIRDIVPNRDILKAMELQMAAERTKRAVIIESEGQRARAVNEAEGIASSRLIDAKASAEALKVKAQAKAKKLEFEAEGAARSIAAIANVLGNPQEAARFQIVREYIGAQQALALSKNAKVILSPDAANDVLVKAMALYDDDAGKKPL